MSNPKTTKLRLLYERAERKRIAAEEALFVAAQVRDQAWISYAHASWADGFCLGCEKSSRECTCVALGMAG